MNKKIFNSQGVALLLVMGVMAILSFILFEFTFETKLNKLKIYNQEDRYQARLNAESGLSFAMAKLRLYQAGRNMIEKNESIKVSFPSSELESILIQPFVYPIPISNKASIIQQNALKEFEKNTNIRGELSVFITKLSGLLNPNSLRVIDKKVDQDKKNITEDEDQAKEASAEDSPEKSKSENNESSKTKENRWETARNLFLKTITQTLEEKLLKDEDFHNKHANTTPESLLNELAFYVNDINKVNGQEYADAKNKFSKNQITPKHAPMASIDELYLLPTWDDSIIEMLKDRMSVNELTSIPVNEMNNADLKIIFPEINNIQIEEFFKYRDGDPDKKIRPNKFKSADDFKNIVTSKLNIVSDSEYQKRVAELKNAGLVIDTAGKLFKVVAKGVYNNATYTINAIIDLPVKETPKKPVASNGQKAGATTPIDPNNENSSAPEDNKTKEKELPIELLLPRVVEIRVE